MYDLSNVVKAGLGFLGSVFFLFLLGILLKFIYLAFMLGWNLL